MAKLIKCKDCRKLKNHFSKGFCKSCYFYQYNKSRKDKIKKYNKEYYNKHREESSIACKEWRENHTQERSDYLREWRENNPNYNRDWCKSNIEKRRKTARESDRRRRVLKSNAIVEQIDEDKIYKRYGNKCVYCGSTNNLTLDHIIPIANNGNHTEDNLVVACRSCNSSKQDKPLKEWLITKFGINEILFQAVIRKINRYYALT